MVLVDQVVYASLRTGALSLWDFASPLAFCSHGLGNGKLIKLHPMSSVYS